MPEIDETGIHESRHAVGENHCPRTLGASPHATQNACKMCTPLGAALAFAGVEGCLSILHGSQGCATYIRRYLISHFREPMDIASSSFSEEDAIFGGGRNLKAGLDNVRVAYQPSLMGVATTCLAETIGEDVPQILREYRESKAGEVIPPIVHVSTASYSGDHWDGFHKTVRALVEQLVDEPAGVATETPSINLFGGMLSCEDLRFLKRSCADAGLTAHIIPDYSETLDGGSWSVYRRIPDGGTPAAAIAGSSASMASVTLGALSSLHPESAGAYLEGRFAVPHLPMPLPMGIEDTDRLLSQLALFAKGSAFPWHPDRSPLLLSREFESERSRLIDAYVDGHKYVAGKRVAVFADPDLLAGLVAFLSETGLVPVLLATGSKVANTGPLLRRVMSPDGSSPPLLTGVDHASIADQCRELRPDLILGNSKGYPIARELGVPLVRCGMPIHDRIGAQRVLHLGYRGAQRLYDQIVNTLLEHRQDESGTGFSYL